jgi:hypothetical protein
MVTEPLEEVGGGVRVDHDGVEVGQGVIQCGVFCS